MKYIICCIFILSVVESFGEIFRNNSIIPNIETLDVTTESPKPPPQMGCRDEDNNIVDWFLAYKFPRSGNYEYQNFKPENHTFAQSGYRFVYLTSDSTTSEWVPSLHSLEQNNIRNSIIGTTLTQQNVADYTNYNDGGGGNSNKAHAKGTLWKSFDDSGFWMIHSTPSFNPTPSSLDYPYGATARGQLFFCMSFHSIDTYNEIRDHLDYIDANYIRNLVEQLELNMEQLEIEETIKPSEVLRDTVIYGNNNIPYRLFGKRISDLYDIYDAASELLHPDAMENAFHIVSYTTKLSSANDVRKISIEIPEVLGYFPPVTVEWGAITACDAQRIKSQDHSKWAISVDTESPKYVCIGDLNRNGGGRSEVKEYHKRGGGLLCFENDILRNSLRSLIPN